MIVDSSALLAIVFREIDAESLARKIAQADVSRLSAVSFVESSVIVDSRTSASGSRRFDEFVRYMDLQLEPVTEEQAYLACQAYAELGKGRHPAALNLGDCFAYALARATGESLLFKGEDFTKTDIDVA